MLSKISGFSAVAAVALMVGSVPTLAHEGHDEMCGGVADSRAANVMTSSGKPLLLGSSEPCPVVEQVAVVDTGDTRGLEPSAAPVVLPHDGMLYFALGSDQIDAEDQAMLDDIVAAVKDQNPESITVMGHTDLSGPAEYNMDLSQRRAEGIAEALVAAGIPADAINTMGYGQTRPAVATEDGVAMRQNRRAELSAE
ncbi:MAG: OmpA family protein [Geminicoccaceae bacterium]